MSFDIAIIKSDVAEVSCVAVIKNGKILMGKRNDTGRWTLPGGHLEKNEDAADGAVRELFEEAGLKVNTKELKHLKSQKLTSELGKKLEVHAYSYDDWDGMTTPTSKNDPDKEVKKWEWIDYSEGLPEEVKSNLHARKNIALIALGLMKGLIMDDMNKGGAGSGVRGHHTDVAVGEAVGHKLRQPDHEKLRDPSQMGHDSLFYISGHKKWKNEIEDDKIKQREEETWKKLMAELKDKQRTGKSFSLVLDLMKGQNGHKYLRKYQRAGKWIYVYYEPGNKPRRIEDKALKILKRLAELGDHKAKALLDSVQEHPQEKLTALRAAARQGIEEAQKKLKTKYGINHKEEEMEDALIPGAAHSNDAIHQNMTPEQKAHLKANAKANIEKMFSHLEGHRNEALYTKLAEHGVTRESLMEGVDSARSLHEGFKKLHENLKKVDAAHEGLASRNSWATDHGTYAHSIYNRTLKDMETHGHLPRGYADLHKRNNGVHELTPAAEMAERQRRAEQEARERAERERQEAAERRRREEEELEREEAGLTSSVGYHMANMIDGVERMSRADKVRKAKEINQACRRIFGKELTKEDFPYNFEHVGMKTVIKHIRVQGDQINMDMEVHNSDGMNIMDGWSRTWDIENGRPHIYNSYMGVRSDYRGTVQIGSLINQGQRKLMKSLPNGGTVSVHANCDVGGYNWANQGFSFKDGGLANARSNFRSFLDREGIHLTDEQMSKFTEPCHFAAFTNGKKYIQEMRRAINLSQTQKDSGSLTGVPGEHPLTPEEISTGMSNRMAVHLGKKFLLGQSWRGRWDSARETDASRYAERYYQLRERASKVLNDEYKGLVADVQEGRIGQRPARPATPPPVPRPSPTTSTPTSSNTERSARVQRSWQRTPGSRIRMTPQRVASVSRWDDANFNHFILHAPITRDARIALREARRARSA